MPVTGLLDAKSCQLCLGDPGWRARYLADGTTLITAAAKSSAEEDGWQGTSGRQWRPGSFVVRKSYKCLARLCAGAMRQLFCIPAWPVPKRFVLPCGFADSGEQSHSKLGFMRADKLTVKITLVTEQPCGFTGLLSLGHRFLSSTCPQASSFQNLHKYLALGFSSPSCSFSKISCQG